MVAHCIRYCSCLCQWTQKILLPHCRGINWRNFSLIWKTQRFWFVAYDRVFFLHMYFLMPLFQVIDEKSMISTIMLYQINMRLREAFPEKNRQPFGGLSVVMMGDFAQLVPVTGKPLYDVKTSLVLIVPNSNDFLHTLIAACTNKGIWWPRLPPL